MKTLIAKFVTVLAIVLLYAVAASATTNGVVVDTLRCSYVKEVKPNFLMALFTDSTIEKGTFDRDLVYSEYTEMVSQKGIVITEIDGAGRDTAFFDCKSSDNRINALIRVDGHIMTAEYK